VLIKKNIIKTFWDEFKGSKPLQEDLVYHHTNTMFFNNGEVRIMAVSIKSKGMA